MALVFILVYPLGVVFVEIKHEDLEVVLTRTLYFDFELLPDSSLCQVLKNKFLDM